MASSMQDMILMVAAMMVAVGVSVAAKHLWAAFRAARVPQKQRAAVEDVIAVVAQRNTAAAKRRRRNKAKKSKQEQPQPQPQEQPQPVAAEPVAEAREAAAAVAAAAALAVLSRALVQVDTPLEEEEADDEDMPQLLDDDLVEWSLFSTEAEKEGRVYAAGSHPAQAVPEAGAWNPWNGSSFPALLEEEAEEEEEEEDEEQESSCSASVSCEDTFSDAVSVARSEPPSSLEPFFSDDHTFNHLQASPALAGFDIPPLADFGFPLVA